MNDEGAAINVRRLPLRPSRALDLFVSGYPTDSVRIAAQQFIEDVRSRSQREDLDGAALMHAVFQPDQPDLAFPGKRDRGWRNRQEGFRFLAVGLVMHVRNNLAHTPDEIYEPDEACEWLVAICALQRLLERTVPADPDFASESRP